jgi:hypothetical protein
MSVATLALISIGVGAPPPATELPGAREALAPFNVLVGAWRGSGAPEGTKEERAAGAWNETIEWVWQFKGQDAWLAAAFEKGKHFTKGELRYTPDRDDKTAPPRFTLTLTKPDKSTASYAGSLKEKTLTLNRVDGRLGDEERLVFSLLHHNRHLYRLETRPAGSTVAFTRRFQVGATKEGVPFADVPKGPECIVSGGLGTIRVSHAGKEYWVCCSGCRDEFKENPDKYVKELEAKAKKP